MNTKAIVIIAVAGIIFGLISIGVAYYRGKKQGSYEAKPNVTQYDVKALDELKKKIAEAQAELDKVTAEANKRRQELDQVLAIPNEEERLKALSNLANQWGDP